MIRLLRCIKKRHDISDMDFRHFWDASEYASTFEAYMNVSEGISYQKNLVLKIDLNEDIQMIRGTQAPYDGVIELFWPSAKNAAALVNTPEGRALVEKLAAYENQFVDFSRSSISLTEST